MRNIIICKDVQYIHIDPIRAISIQTSPNTMIKAIIENTNNSFLNFGIKANTNENMKYTIPYTGKGSVKKVEYWLVTTFAQFITLFSGQAKDVSV